jgi:hypothetical protein
MPNREDLSDLKLLGLSESDAIDWRTAYEGIFGAGSSGSGKTACLARTLRRAMLSKPGKNSPNRAGALILCAKEEEKDNAMEDAGIIGRSKDVILFNEKSGLCFDPIYYEMTHGSGDLESVIDLFSTIVDINKNDRKGQNHEPFWDRANEQRIRDNIKFHQLAGERVSIANLDSTFKSFPTDLNRESDKQWKADHRVGQMIDIINANRAQLTPDQLSDLDIVGTYIFDHWPSFDPRPRSSVEMTWSGMADKFLFNPYNRIFSSGKCDFTPEDTTHRNKIIICDWPMLKVGHETGRTINIISKLIFQRAWLRRDLNESPNPCLLSQDEMQYFIVPKWDNFFQQTCRGSRIANLCLTQNISNISEAFGEEYIGSKTKSFLGNFGTKIFLQQNEIDTCTYAADQIGKHWVYVDSWGAGSNEGHTHTHFTGNKQLVHIVEPLEFQKLKKPDGQNPLAEAIVYKSGETFKANKNYLRVHFSREI